MTRIYFVRHAQPDHSWEADRTRPLTTEGSEDSRKVLKVLQDKNIDSFYCSPYKRSLDTIGETAAHYGKEIITDERLRERESGRNGNHHELFRKRWEDHDFHEEGGESIIMVQGRNVAALKEILRNNDGRNIVIGTHGTALSSILNYYDTDYDCDSFLRILDWMPYIIELDFEDGELMDKIEHLHIKKEFLGK